MLKLKGHDFRDVIYGYETEACGFGDAFAVTNYLLRASERIKKPVRFACHNRDLRERVRFISTYLDTPGRINIVNARKQKILGYCEPFGVKFVRTKRRWRYNHWSKIVAYQFDGRHLAEEKNLPPDRVDYLVKQLKMMGYNPIDVGNHKPLGYVIDVLAKCRFFVGCPSGIAHVSQSVGNPIYVITKEMKRSYLNFMRRCQYRTAQVHMTKYIFDFLRVIHNEQPTLCLS